MRLPLLPLALAASLLGGCSVRTEGPMPSASGGGVAPTPSGDPGSPSSSAASILVEVDTDKTMTAEPGAGVGVFVEYAAGGHWNVRWTCDTNVNPSGPVTCDFGIRATVTSGAIALTQTTAPAAAVQLSGVPAQEFDAHTTTGADLHGARFDTTPGAVVTLQATLGGQLDGRYFFFVQDGVVNGGYTGTLSDPLQFQGSKP